jgi:calcineurin-like phosphoesterase family protein
MSNIYITSDLHFCHDRAFVYEPRGFPNIDEMNQAIVDNWNSIVQPDDIVYVLGDIMLNDNEQGLKLLKSLKGEIHIVLGNHDTATREALYKDCQNVAEVALAEKLKYKGYHFFMTHYPCLTGNLDNEKPLKQRTISLCGHTHTKDPFLDWKQSPIFHCEIDTNDCYPWLLDDIIKDMENYNKIFG